MGKEARFRLFVLILAALWLSFLLYMSIHLR